MYPLRGFLDECKTEHSHRRWFPFGRQYYWNSRRHFGDVMESKDERSFDEDGVEFSELENLIREL